MERAVADQLRRLGDEALDPSGIGEVRREMMRPVGIALALGRHVLARGGDDAPAGLAEAPHRGMADAAARAGEEQGLVVSHVGRVRAAAR